MLGEDYGYAQPSARVPNFYLMPFFGLYEPALYVPFDMELFDVVLAFGRAQRNENIPAVAFLIPVHCGAG